MAEVQCIGPECEDTCCANWRIDVDRQHFVKIARVLARTREGQQELARFYQSHFVNGNPADTKLIPVSRTIGADRGVDEMLFCFTHDREIDWMLPGVAPTGKYVEVPLVAIVCFRGNKIYHEHIYWDQATVLAQIGLIDKSNLPVAGVESAKKLIDEKLPSNTLMKRWAESEGKA